MNIKWELGHNGYWLNIDGKNYGLVYPVIKYVDWNKAGITEIKYQWEESINHLDDNFGGVEPTLALAASALLDWLKLNKHI